MDEVVKLFCSLILTLISITTPIVSILLSIFQEGIEKLRQRFETEKKQSETKLESQLIKKYQAEHTDLDAIQRTVSELRAIKKKAEYRLGFLNPKKQLLQLFLPLLFSFIFTLLYFVVNFSVTIYDKNFNIKYIFFSLGVVIFSYSLYILSNLSLIIFEVVRIIDSEKTDREKKTIELLSTIAEKDNKSSEIFVKNVTLTFDNQNLEKKVPEVLATLNIQQKFKIGISNRDKRTIKNTELGLIFPKEFIIDQPNSNYSIYTDNKDGRQIIRFEDEYIHADTHFFHYLKVTPIASGSYEIRLFLKGENVEVKEYKFIVKVI